MYGKRKIAKEIDKLTKPQLSFEDFCAKNGVPVEKDVVQGNTVVKTRRLTWIASAVLLVIGAVAALLMIFMPRATSPPSSPKLFRSDEIHESITTEEEFCDGSINTFFDFSKVALYGGIYRLLPETDEMLLGYSVHNIAYGFYVDDKFYAYEVEMTIRVYEGMEYLESNSYERLENRYGDCTYGMATGKYALVYTNRDGNDYFIRVSDFYGNDLPIERVELLLKEIFGAVNSRPALK